VKIYENLDVLPRAFLVHRARFFLNDDELLAAILSNDFEPGSEALLSGERGSAERYGQECEDLVRLVSYTAERITVEAETSCPGYLVLSDAHYPGWVALVDGRPEEIRRANFYFRAVFIPSGQHRIEFVYQPNSFKLGVALSFAAALIAVAGLAWEMLTRRRCP
jgi:hypothetical protein